MHIHKAVSSRNRCTRIVHECLLFSYALIFVSLLESAVIDAS